MTMRITKGPSQPAVNGTSAATASEAPGKTARAAKGQVNDTSRDAATLRAAQGALSEASDFDIARVNQIKTALEAGEIPFDADKLAGMIQRFHGKQR